MNNDNTDFDVLIIGGGLVGASLACALRELPLRVGVVEAHTWDDTTQPSFDARSVALAYSSKDVFAAMSLWPAIEALGAAPIRHIHVSDRGHPGLTRLHAEDYRLDALGYVVETRVLGKVLWEAMASADNIDLVCPAQLNRVHLADTDAQIEIEQDSHPRVLTSRLLVAADGGHSRVRDLLGIRSFTLGYDQCAVIANLSMDQSHGFTAYERFTESGPLALLPLQLSSQHGSESNNTASGDYSLVWTQPASRCEATLALSDEAFIAALQSGLGDRAGQITHVGKRDVYPLTLMRSREQVRTRLAIVGNAAHTLHPVAGQGFNLGLRDVAALSQVVADAVWSKQDLGSLAVLNRYADWRRRDQLQVGLITDGLVRVFSNKSLPLVMARNLGMIAVDVVPPLKRMLARHAMGFVGRMPRLTRGLPLHEPVSGK